MVGWVIELFVHVDSQSSQSKPFTFTHLWRREPSSTNCFPSRWPSQSRKRFVLFIDWKLIRECLCRVDRHLRGLPLCVCVCCCCFFLLLHTHVLQFIITSVHVSFNFHEAWQLCKIISKKNFKWKHASFSYFAWLVDENGIASTLYFFIVIIFISFV